VIIIVLTLLGCRTEDYRNMMHIQTVVADGTRLCKVHGERLHPDTVPIHYGTPSHRTIQLYQAEDVQFPNAHRWLGGGCITSNDDPQRAKVLYCRTCRELQEKWRVEHGW
jgi:hypothetical protein